MPVLAIQSATNAPSGLFYLVVSGTLIAICIAWIFRVRNLMRLRANIRRIYALSEEMLSARSAAEMQTVLADALPGTLRFRDVVIWEEGQVGRTIESATPNAGAPSDHALRCFRSGTKVRTRAAKRDLWLPMLVDGRAAGVLELRRGRRGARLHVEEEAALQHLANQIAIALQLIGQNALREQVLRNERLGAVGQLIAGVASELHAPVSRLAAELSRLEAHDGESGRPIGDLLHLAEDASRTVSRLVAIGTAVQGPAQPVDVGKLLKTLNEFRAQSWRLQGIELQFEPMDEPLSVMASPGQLEQAFLSLFIHVERSIAQHSKKQVALTATRIVDQAVIELTLADTGVRESPSLHVVQEIVRSQNGTLRVVQHDDETRYTISLPVGRSASLEQIEFDDRVDTGPMTILLYEPDVNSRRALLEMLSAHGHRVVPVQSAWEAQELAGRLAFEAVFTTSSLRDSKWLELYEQVRRLSQAFVLMYDAGSPAPVEARDVLLLAKPVEQRELKRLLSVVAQRAAARPAG